MEEVLMWPERTYPAIAMLVVGAGLVGAGLRASYPDSFQARDGDRVPLPE
jgi:hypothetical protein